MCLFFRKVLKRNFHSVAKVRAFIHKYTSKCILFFSYKIGMDLLFQLCSIEETDNLSVISILIDLAYEPF